MDLGYCPLILSIQAQFKADLSSRSFDPPLLCHYRLEIQHIILTRHKMEVTFDPNTSMRHISPHVGLIQWERVNQAELKGKGASCDDGGRCEKVDLFPEW